MVPPQPSLHDVKRLVTHAEHHHTGFSPTPWDTWRRGARHSKCVLLPRPHRRRSDGPRRGVSEFAAARRLGSSSK